MATKRRRTGWWILLAIVVLGVVGAILLVKSGSKDKTTYRTATVSYGDVSASVSADGSLACLNTYDVKSNVGGVITELDVDEGDYVKAGQKIADVDPVDTQMALDQATANTMSANSKLTQTAQNYSITKAQDDLNIATANQGVIVAQKRLHQAEITAKVQPGLTIASIDQAIAAVAQAKANISLDTSNCEDAEAAFELMRDVSNPQASIAAKTALDQAQANFDQARTNLARQKALLDKGFVPQSTVDTAQQQNDTTNAQLANAREVLATVDQQNAHNLKSAQAKSDAAKLALQQANAALDATNAALDAAQKNQANDILRTDDYEAAKAALIQADKALDLAVATSKQEAMRAQDIQQSKFALQNAAAVERNAKTDRAWCTATAPVNGIVLQKFVQVGSTVVNGRQSAVATGTGVSIVTLGDINNMTAVVDVDETEIAQIKFGQKATISVDAYPDSKFEGTIIKIAPQTTIVSNVTTVPVTVAFSNSDKRLRPGMTATCDFVTQRVSHVLMVPDEAVKVNGNSSTVSVLLNGKPVVRTVTVGLEGDESSEIVDGLVEGEKVVTATITPAAGGQTSSTTSKGSGGASKNGPPHGPF